MKAILIGYGEVGQAVEKVFGRNHEITIADPDRGYEWSPSKYGAQDLALVCIPWSPDIFIHSVRDWATLSGAEAILVFSTVPIGTCSNLGASHYPVEGKHPNIAHDMEKNVGILGGNNDIIELFLAQAGQDYRVLDKPEWSEFLKLRSLTYFALCLEFSRYTAGVCTSLGLDYQEVQRYDAIYNDVVRLRGDHRQARPILDPPAGAIGGHCVLPGVRMLYDNFESPLLWYVHIMNRSIEVVKSGQIPSVADFIPASTLKTMEGIAKTRGIPLDSILGGFARSPERGKSNGTL